MKVTVLISVLTVSTVCCTIGLMVWAWTDSNKGGNRSNISEAKNNNTSESDNENHNELGNENEILSTNINSEYNEEEHFDICDPCEKSKPKNLPESSPGSICNGLFSSTEENLTAELPVFGYGTEDTYNSCHDLEVDLRSAASIIINQEIQRQVKKPRNMFNNRQKMSTNGISNAETNNKFANLDTDIEDSFGTNNQNKDADEGDVVKSNGKHAFLGNGNTIVAWDVHTGAILSTTTLTIANQSSSRVLDVQSMLLHESRLLVIFKSKSKRLNSKSKERDIVLSKHDTFVNIYDISNLPDDGSELELFTTHFFQGTHYTAARSVHNIAYIVTSSIINVQLKLNHPVWKRKPLYFNLSNTEYVPAAITHATKIVIPEFIDLMMTHLKSEEGTCNHIVKLSIFQAVDRPDRPCTGEVSPVHTSHRMMDNLVTITTFNMTSRNNPETNPINGKNELILNVSKTNAFMPGHHDTLVYSTSDYLFVSGRGFQYTNTSWVDQTFIMAFALNSGNNGVKVRGFGNFPGIINNVWAFDVTEGHIRVASASYFKYICKHSRIYNMNNASNEKCVWTQVSHITNHVTILKIPSDVHFKNKRMSKTGYLGEIGEGESIISVRFMEDKVFIVTFFGSGQFFTIDLSDYRNPKLVGRLTVSFSVTYLHPYDSSGNILIAVGRNAKKSQIILLDTTVFAKPSVLSVYNMEDVSYSDHDHAAFRFLPESKKLIMPVLFSGEKKFDGFLIFNLKINQEISLYFNISHNENKNTRCGKWKEFAGRSLVRDGIITTIKAHSIIAHKLETRQRTWDLKLDDTAACFLLGWAY